MKITANKQWEIQYSSIGFAGGERHIQLEQMNEVPEAPTEISIRAGLSSSNDVMDLLLVENALRHAFAKDFVLNLELPYLPYARQDRVCASGQAFSLEVFAGMIKSMNPNRIVTWDCHSNVGLALTGAINVSPEAMIRTDAALLALLQQENSVLVCPDKGAIQRCTDISQKLGVKEMVFCEKQRDPSTGKIYRTDVLAEDLSGKCAVISDDICDGGYTFIKIAEQLRAKKAERIVLFVTHGIFSKGLSVFDGLIDEVITTNSFPQTANPKLKVIDFEYDVETIKGEK